MIKNKTDQGQKMSVQGQIIEKMYWKKYNKDEVNEGS